MMWITSGKLCGFWRCAGAMNGHISEGVGETPRPPHPDERSEEGTHDILQPFGLQDER